MSDEISVDIAPVVVDEVRTRRFAWRLRAPGQQELPSPQSFATRREAVADGEIARQRALQRGRIAR